MQSTLPRLSPMPLSRAKLPFDDPDWLFEIKFDGFRALAYFFGDRCQLVSRRGNVYSSRVSEAISVKLNAKNAVLDGELCCLGRDGRSIFSEFLRRKLPFYFYAFDLLWLNGTDLRQKPLIERKVKLRWLIPEQLAPLFYLDHVEENGVALFEDVCTHDMEGIVAKRKNGLYLTDARKSSWVKIKNPHYSQMDGRHELFSSRTSL